jgi:hypothetical protein
MQTIVTITNFEKSHKIRTTHGTGEAGVISTAGLSKFNIIPKAFIPSTSSILLLQKATKR